MLENLDIGYVGQLDDADFKFGLSFRILSMVAKL